MHDSRGNIRAAGKDDPSRWNMRLFRPSVLIRRGPWPSCTSDFEAAGISITWNGVTQPGYRRSVPEDVVDGTRNRHTTLHPADKGGQLHHEIPSATRLSANRMRRRTRSETGIEEVVTRRR